MEAKLKPIVMAITVVKIYKTIVLNPILERLAVSLRSETPFIRLTKISGIAISLSNFIKMSPKGAIQSLVKDTKPVFIAIIPNTTPNSIDTIILIDNGVFFIFFNLDIALI